MTWQEIIDIVKTKEHKSVEGKISCSSLPVLKLCGGSLKAQRKVKKISKKYDQEGSALHYCMEYNIIPSDISDDNREKLDKALRVHEHLLNNGWVVFESETFLEGEWLCGTPDRIYTNGEDFLVLDWKFGWQKVSDDSPQMLGYTYIVCHKYGLKKVYSCVVQPERGEVNILVHDWNDLADKMHPIDKNEEKGNRTPSAEACQFCSACGTFACPETQEISHELTKPELNGVVSVENMRKHAHLIPVMEMGIANFKAQVKAREGGGHIDGCYIKEGYERYTVESPRDAGFKLEGTISMTDVFHSSTITFFSFLNLQFRANKFSIFATLFIVTSKNSFGGSASRIINDLCYKFATY